MYTSKLENEEINSWIRYTSAKEEETMLPEAEGEKKRSAHLCE